jgi:hypothetical protein
MSRIVIDILMYHPHKTVDLIDAYTYIREEQIVPG